MDYKSELEIEKSIDEVDEYAPPSPRWLKRRLRAWEGARIITHDQAMGIREFEDTHADAAESAFRYQRVIVTVSAFGGILLAAGIMLLVGSNWADLGRLSKVAIAVATVVGIESAGYWLRYHTAYRRTGGTFLFVGAAAYGAATMLVAQAYHYSIDDPNLLVLWFVPVLPLAYLVRTRMIAALGIGVGYAALGYRAADWFDRPGSDDFGWQLVYLAVGGSVVAVGYLHDRFRDGELRSIGRPFLWIGSLTVLGITYAMSFEGWYQSWGGARGLDVIPIEVWIVIVFSVIVAGGAVIALLAGMDRLAASAAGVGVGAGATYVVTLILLVHPAGASTVPFVLVNLAMFGAVVGYVAVGVVTRQEALINLALVFFGLAVVSRYIEIGGGMFGTSVSMMLGGVLLIGLAWGLERLRRNLLTRYELRGTP